MIRKILVPLDGSPLADRILAQVGRILLCEDAEVRLLRILPEGAPDLVREAERWLGKRREGLESEGTRCDFAVLQGGDPAERILGYADEFRPSLVAMSTHGRTGVKRWTRGSVAERVLRGSKWPLLMWNPMRDRRAGPRTLRFGRILVPLDGSEASAGILPLVAALARLYESGVILLHSAEIYPVANDFPMVQVPPDPKALARMLDGYRRRLKGIPVAVKGVLGPPAEAILDEARRSKIDLVAMTTHGRSGVSRWAYGSVAEQVLRHCPHPMLVLRNTGFSEGVAPKASRA